jgi:hypothetical protein
MMLILGLPDKKEAALRAKAESQSVSPEQYAEEVLSRDLDQPIGAAAPKPRTARFGKLSSIK